jgi:hypothetical protein
LKSIIKTIVPLTCIFIFSSCLKSSKVNDTKFVLIDYKYGFNNELNTFNDTYIKNFTSRGKIKIKLHLSNPEQDKIINKALRIGFFDMPDLLNINNQYFEGYCDSTVAEKNIQFLRIKYKNLDKKIIWNGALLYNNPETQNLAELTFLIRKIIESKPAYKSLPEINSSSIQYYFRILIFLFK